MNISDVVTAYKSLLKEKEALEESLATLTTNNKSSNTSNQNENASSSTKSEIKNNSSSNSGEQMEMQISTLMNSLATLSAEKSKMEASFQIDKKTMRNELKIKDKIIADLQEKLNASMTQTKLEVEKLKSKLIIERHEWEKESGNQLAMVREMQKLLGDERQIKGNLEMQLKDLKAHISVNTMDGNSNRFSEVLAELEQTKQKLKENERELSKTTQQCDIPSESVLKKLQSEMMHLKKQHTTAIQSEQHRAYLAEERNKALAAMHEERVANLENRLTELSETVGLYDRLRKTDQDNIAKFKEKIAQLTNNKFDEHIDNNTNSKMMETQSSSDKYSNWNINELINEILLLHNVLLLENSKLETPVDISKLYSAFNSTAKSNDNTCNCAEKYESLLKENAMVRAENEISANKIETLKLHIKTLQSKVEVLNRNIDEQETELRNKMQVHKGELVTERNRWKELVANNEIEFRAKQSELEIQLQKQRERSLQLLEEKENEIASLKASFNIFMMPMKPMRKRSGDHSDTDKSTNGSTKDAKETLANFNNVIHSSNEDINQTASLNLKEPMHMLHYVHELSRKEVEIVGLRRSKHSAEQLLRQTLQDKAATQEHLYDKISMLEEQVDRLERCKTREGANLEYLKNVFLSFLLSQDVDGRKHKVSAIAAVLELSPSELNSVNKYFNIKNSNNINSNNKK